MLNKTPEIKVQRCVLQQQQQQHPNIEDTTTTNIEDTTTTRPRQKDDTLALYLASTEEYEDKDREQCGIKDLSRYICMYAHIPNVPSVHMVRI